MPPAYAHLLLEAAIAAATGIAAVVYYRPTTRLGAHDSPLHLRDFILLYPPRLPSHRVPIPHPPSSSYPYRDPHTDPHTQITNRLSIAGRLSLILLANLSL